MYRKLMDPSQVQSDKENDTNSLEDSGTTVNSDQKTTDTSAPSNELESSNDTSDPSIDARDSNGASTTPANAPPKLPIFKRIWQKFNIYLLLFALVILVAIGITLGLFLKNRSDTKKSESIINSQN